MTAIFNTIDYLLEKFNKYPVASFLMFISLLLYFYTINVSQYLDSEKNIHVVENETGWCIAANEGHKEYDSHGSSYEFDEIELSETFKTKEEAINEKKRFLGEINTKLSNIDFLHFRILGSLFIRLPYIIFGLLGVYDLFRIKKNNSK